MLIIIIIIECRETVGVPLGFGQDAKALYLDNTLRDFDLEIASNASIRIPLHKPKQLAERLGNDGP